jgi:twitching motility protein PilT
MPCTNAGLAGGEEGPHVDPQHPAGLDGFFAPVTPAPVAPAPAPSPLDPDWGYVATPPAQLSSAPAPAAPTYAAAVPQAADASTPAYAAPTQTAPVPQPAPIELAAPTMSFAPAPTAAPPVAAPAPVPAPIPVLAPAVAAPAPRPAPTPAPVAVVPAQPARAAAPADANVRIGAEDTTDDVGFLTDLLLHVLEHKSSDLHLTIGARPTVRQHGHLTPLDAFEVLTPTSIQKTLYAIMSQRQREKFEEELELDFAYSVPGKARFRVNVYRQRDAMGAAFRLIPFEIKPLEDLGLPPAIANLAMLPRGFVLVTGPTGSGKSTTLASIVDLANRNRADHIMTVEDPIEFLHNHKKCLVNQREVGEDTWSFKNALKHVLRQDPDIILVGEMRDLETIEIALTAAETGHLVMATLHTQDAARPSTASSTSSRRRSSSRSR